MDDYEYLKKENVEVFYNIYDLKEEVQKIKKAILISFFFDGIYFLVLQEFFLFLHHLHQSK